jgi:nitroreductase
MPDPARFIPLPDYHEYPATEMADRAARFNADMQRRRTVRQFADRPVAQAIIDDCIRTAGSAPSGANMQPWHFVAVADPAIKKEIRIGAEKEEREFYKHRATPEWREAIAPLGTDAKKPFLETAPWLITVFMERYGLLPDGRKVKRFYPAESVGLATGLLIAAVHHAGLVSLTHTPSPMKFLNTILHRPSHEVPFLILVVGYPTADAVVPKIERKPLSEIMTIL